MKKPEYKDKDKTAQKDVILENKDILDSSPLLENQENEHLQEILEEISSFDSSDLSDYEIFDKTVNKIIEIVNKEYALRNINKDTCDIRTKISSLIDYKIANPTDNNSEELKESLALLLNTIKIHIENIISNVKMFSSIINKKKLKEKVVLLQSENQDKLKNYLEKKFQVKRDFGLFQIINIHDIYKNINFLKFNIEKASSLNNNSLDFDDIKKNALSLNDHNTILLEKTNLDKRKVYFNVVMAVLNNNIRINVNVENFIEDFAFFQESQETSISNLFVNSLYFTIIWKLCHTTNTYLVQPDLSVYLEEIGFDQYDSGYVIALMNFAKLISCIWYSFWTNTSYRNPYYFALGCNFFSNILYAMAIYTSNLYISYSLIVISRILIGLGSAKIVHKRMTIDFSTYFNLFFYAGMLMLMNNLGRGLGPLLNLCIHHYITPSMTKEMSFVIPSILYSLVWVAVLFYLGYKFEDPYDIKEEIEKKLTHQKIKNIYQQKNTHLENQLTITQENSNQRPTLSSSLSLHIVVLILIFTVYMGIIEFQLWSLPIIMSEIFGYGIEGYTIYTVLVMITSKFLILLSNAINIPRF